MFFINRKFQWTEYKIVNENQEFFILRWFEIFNESTFDSWQLRTSNIQSVLLEILEVVETTKKVHSHHANIKILLDELEIIAKNDYVIKRYYPFFFPYLKNICEIYEKNIKNDQKLNFKLFISNINVILSQLKDYREYLFIYLRELLGSTKNEKGCIYSLSLNLGVLLKNEGYSIKELQSSIDIFIKNTEMDFLSRFDKFKYSYNGSFYEYECSFAIHWPKSAKESPIFSDQISFYDKKTFEINNKDSDFLKSINKEDTIVCIKVNSSDVYSARQKAEYLLENIFSIKKLFQIEKSVIIRNNLCLVKSDKASMIISKNHRKFYIRDSKKSDEHAVEFQNMLSKIDENDSRKISSSLEYHKLGIISSSNEARLVNLWIALESIIPVNNNSIISRITKLVPDSLLTEYISTLLRETCKLIHPYITLNKKNVKKLNLLNDRYLTPGELLNILVDVKDGVKIRCLFDIVSENKLLLFRLNKLWKVFNSSDSLCSFLDNHKKNLKMQLCRIYRTRNNIMHQGECNYQIEQLIQHLHTYYVSIVHNLRHDLNQNEGLSIVEALTYRTNLCQYMMRCLKEYSENPFPITNFIWVDKFLKSHPDAKELSKWIDNT